MKQRTVRENIKLKGGLRSIKKSERSQIYLVLDNIKAMENVGAMFRTADAARVKKIFLCGITATPPRNKIFKTSMGAVEWLEWEYFAKTEDAIKELKKIGAQIVCLEQTNQSVLYNKAKYKSPIAIVVGNETNGIKNNILKMCDLAVEIPMHGKANSLNVATSTGIILFEVLSKI